MSIQIRMTAYLQVSYPSNEQICEYPKDLLPDPFSGRTDSKAAFLPPEVADEKKINREYYWGPSCPEDTLTTPEMKPRWEPQGEPLIELSRFSVMPFHSLQRKVSKLSQVIESDEKRRYREFVLASVRSCSYGLLIASDELRNDPEVVLASLIHDGTTFKNASDALRDNRDFVLRAVRYAKTALPYASARLQRDPEIIAASEKGLIRFQMKRR